MAQQPDPETLEHLRRVFAALDNWRARVENLPPTPAQGSSLHGDDRVSDPFHVSHAVGQALFAAVDHLDSLRTMIERGGVVHSHASFTVLRAAIENASVAIWLLAPSNRNERLLRRLRLQWADFVDGNQAAGGDSTRLQGNKERLQEIGRNRGLTQDQISQIAANQVSYTTIVTKASEAVPEIPPGIALLCWRACSGIAHSKTWAALSILDQSDSEEISAGVIGLRVTASDTSLSVTASVAAVMILNAWRLYDTRSAAY